MTGSNIRVASRVRDLAGSPTVAVNDKARRLFAEGHAVVNLSGGDPDFPTDEHIMDAAVEALREGFTHYTSSRGIPELLNAIADKLRQDNGAIYDPDAEILVLPGAKQGIFVAAQTLIEPGDEVILFDPGWVSYAPCVQLAGGIPVWLTVTVDTTAAELATALEAAISPRTRMVIVNTPNNPTGQVWAPELVQAVADAAQAHDLWVISDEIYEKLVYDGHTHVSMAGLPGMLERTIIVNGLSKSHAMTGWRLGYLAAPAALTKQMLKIHQHSTTCATSFVQSGAVAALQGPQDYTEYMLKRYQARRDMLAAALDAIPGIRCEPPQGAFYAFPNIAGTGLSSLEFTDRLLEVEKVAVTPGIAFGEAGEGHIRLSFANSDEMVAEGGRRIARFVANL